MSRHPKVRRIRNGRGERRTSRRWRLFWVSDEEPCGKRARRVFRKHNAYLMGIAAWEEPCPHHDPAPIPPFSKAMYANQWLAGYAVGRDTPLFRDKRTENGPDVCECFCAECERAAGEVGK